MCDLHGLLGRFVLAGKEGVARETGSFAAPSINIVQRLK
jgi:hypothetical protein